MNDAQVFTDEEIAQVWDADISKYEIRLKDQEQENYHEGTETYGGK